MVCVCIGDCRRSGGSGFSAQAKNPGIDEEGRLGTIFVIAMENHNWTEPAGSDQSPADLQESERTVHQQSGQRHVGHQRSGVVRSNYINAAVGNHPSEPNYIWAEAGTNFGVNNDNDPAPVATSRTRISTSLRS